MQIGEACEACEKSNEFAAIVSLQKAADFHYRETIPKKYRRADQGGKTTMIHSDWKKNRCDIQLAHLQDWNPEKQPWVAIIGGAGHAKSRSVAVHAHRMARSGRRLLWVKAGALAWLHGARYGDKSGGGKDAWSYLRDMQTADVLILDDIWKGITVQYLQTLFHLLEDRYSDSRTVIWTANTHPDDISSICKETIPADILAPLTSRLIGESHLLVL